MIKNKIGIGMFFMAVLLLSTTFMPVVNGATMENNISYTDAELKDLYQINNITDNDLKFAKNELPNFLEGTILCSDKRVIVAEDGKVPRNMKRGENFDIIINEQEMKNIIEKARTKYIEKYNVDPDNPRVDIVDGYALPKETVKKLVKDGKLPTKAEKSLIESDDSLVNKSSSALTLNHVYRNPYQINNRINVKIFIAKEDSHHHAPTESYYQDTRDALNRFASYGITTYRVWYYNFWDASDVTPYAQADVLLDDLEEDTTWAIGSSNDIVLGWVNNMDHNGMSWSPGSFSVCAVTALGVDWPHDSIVQHEVSHNFDASDQNSPLHPECIMNYYYAQQGTNIWCASCWNTVNYGIFH